MVNKLPTVHMIVKNDDRFVWYALQSVLPYARRILITDTGSSDNTVEIIRAIHSSKIKFQQIRAKNPAEISKIRQTQIRDTIRDWIWIVDGDEVYTRKLCEEIVSDISKYGSKLEGIIVKRIELLGDIYHRQNESVGAYDLFGNRGHFAIRLLNMAAIDGLHVEGTYPLEGYFDEGGVEVTARNAKKYFETKGSLFHCVYLARSTQGTILHDTFNRSKYKIEKGLPLPKDTTIPEVFYAKHPPFVPTVTDRRSLTYEIVASLFTPFKQFKRRFFL